MPNLRDRFPIYRRLLRLYPEPYRRTYELSMLQTLADMLDAAPSTAARRSLWLRLAADLPTSIVQQQRIYIGEVMVHDMPKFVKHNAILAALMLAPFSIAVFANLLDQILRHQTLYESWVWDTDILRIWVMWMPAAAVIFTGISLATYLIQRRHVTGQSWVHILLQIQYSWPLIVSFVAGLSVLVLLFGHDSVHCIITNPLHELQNPSATWQCIQRS